MNNQQDRRERIAAQVLAGLAGVNMRATWEMDVAAAVKAADLLIDELDCTAAKDDGEVDRLRKENAAMHQAVELAWRGGKPQGVTDHASGIYLLTRERDEARAEVARMKAARSNIPEVPEGWSAWTGDPLPRLRAALAAAKEQTDG